MRTTTDQPAVYRRTGRGVHRLACASFLASVGGLFVGIASAQTRMQFPTTRPMGPRTTSVPSAGHLSRPMLTRPETSLPTNPGHRVPFERVGRDRAFFVPHNVTNQAPIVYIPYETACDTPDIWTHGYGGYGDRVVVGSGVGLRIGYSDDNFMVSLHAGSPIYSHYGRSLHRSYSCEPVIYPHSFHNVYDIGWRYPRRGYSYAYPNDNWGTSGTEVVYVGATSVAPSYQSQPAQVVHQPEPTAKTSNVPEDILRAAEHLRNGRAGNAIDVLRNFIAINDTDTLATRALAVALIENGDVSAGVSLMGLVYERDPNLASLPIDGAFWVGSDRALRELVRSVSGYANQANTPSGWLTLAALMQAEGRNHNARQMLERAERAGLQSRVLESMLRANGSRRFGGGRTTQ